MKDEIIGTKNPMWSTTNGVKVLVCNLDIARAKLVVVEHEKNLKEE